MADPAPEPLTPYQIASLEASAAQTEAIKAQTAALIAAREASQVVENLLNENVPEALAVFQLLKSISIRESDKNKALAEAVDLYEAWKREYRTP